MDIYIPSADELRHELKKLNMAQLKRLALMAPIPFGTLYKIRSRETVDPGVDKVRRLWPHVHTLIRDAETAGKQVAAQVPTTAG